MTAIRWSRGGSSGGHSRGEDEFTTAAARIGGEVLTGEAPVTFVRLRLLPRPLQQVRRAQPPIQPEQVGEMDTAWSPQPASRSASEPAPFSPFALTAG